MNMIQLIVKAIQDKVSNFKWLCDASKILSIMHQKYTRPVIDFFKPFVLYIANIYKRLFVKMAFVNGTLSHFKAATIAMPVLLFSTWFVLYIGIPETYDFIVDGVGVITERSEHVFLTGAGPVPDDPTESIFRAKGCDTLPCTEDTATYYHIRPNSVKSIIKFFTQGTIYLPEEVEAAIPDQLSECDITIQWFRWRMFKMYNTITEVACMPVAQGK